MPQRRIKVYLPADLMARLQAYLSAAERPGVSVCPSRYLGALLAGAVRRLRNEEAATRGRLIAQWLPMINGLVSKWTREARGCVDESDMLEVALLEATKAAERFDPSKGAFGPYARRWIEPALRDLVARRREEQHSHDDVDELPLEAASEDYERREMLAILQEWAGSSAKRRAVLRMVADAGHLADVPEGMRRSLAAFLQERGIEGCSTPRPVGLSAAQAAAQLGILDRQVRRLCESGKLRAWLVSGEWVVCPQAVARLRQRTEERASSASSYSVTPGSINNLSPMVRALGSLFLPSLP